MEQHVTIPVQGMSCARCVRIAERCLKQVPGVSKATVNLATKRATITFDPAQAGVALAESEGWFLRLAASAERASQHPLAEPTDFQSITGQGIEATVEGQQVLVGPARLSMEGKTPMWMAVDGVAVGILAVADTLKETSRQAVETLEGMGIEVWMMTGGGGP